MILEWSDVFLGGHVVRECGMTFRMVKDTSEIQMSDVCLHET